MWLTANKNLSGESHCEELIKKLNRANGMLGKARQFVPLNELKNIYHAIFSSHLKYGCQIWTQKLLSVCDKMSFLQKTAVRIMTFSHVMLIVNLYSNNWIFLNLMTILFFKIVYVLPSSSEFTFNRVDESHSMKTRMAETGMLPIPRFNSTTYGLKSMYKNCINSLNVLTLRLNLLEKDKAKNNYIEIDLLKMHSKINYSVITDYFLSSYKFSI